MMGKYLTALEVEKTPKQWNTHIQTCKYTHAYG